MQVTVSKYMKLNSHRNSFVLFVLWKSLPSFLLTLQAEVFIASHWMQLVLTTCCSVLCVCSGDQKRRKAPLSCGQSYLQKKQSFTETLDGLGSSACLPLCWMQSAQTKSVGQI